MRAIILAAGRGSRMGALTDLHPKCLTRLASKPLLRWQVEALSQAGIGEVAIVRGYKGEMLDDSGCSLFDNPRWSETNMVMSLACADAWLQPEACIVSYADIVYHPDAVATLIGADGDLVITYDRLWRHLWERRFADPLLDAETFRVARNGSLLEIGGKADRLDEIQGQYMGLLKFTPSGWSHVKAFLERLPVQRRDSLDMTGLLRLLLAQGLPIHAVPVDGRWCEVDSEKDLQLYEDILQSAAGWSHDWRFRY